MSKLPRPLDADDIVWEAWPPTTWQKGQKMFCTTGQIYEWDGEKWVDITDARVGSRK